jgi:hypothetical protein
MVLPFCSQSCDATNHAQRVYHFYRIGRILSGRQSVNRNFENALRSLKQQGHALVFHVGDDERRPSDIRLRMFDAVFDDCVSASVHEALNAFAGSNPYFDVSYEAETCSLIFRTVSRAQQWKDCVREGTGLIDRLIEGQALEKKTNWGDGCYRIQIRQKPDAALEAFYRNRGWLGRTAVRVQVGDEGKGQKDGMWCLGPQDMSIKEIRRVTTALRQGRPWLARRTGVRR